MGTAPPLSATAELVMETLVCRVRLGESFWTFGKRTRRAVQELAGLGFVSWSEGDFGRLRVWLEEPGRAVWMVEDYAPQRFLREEVQTLRRHVAWLEEQAAAQARTRRALEARIDQLEGGRPARPARPAVGSARLRGLVRSR